MSRGFDSQWRDEFQPRFMKLISHFHDNIQGLFFGHIHRDSFGVQIDENSDTPLNSFYIGSSVTPRSENNPSYRVMSYDPTSFEITDYLTYSFDLPSVMQSSGPISISKSISYWHLEYSFSASYLNDQDLSPEQLAGLVKALSADQSEFDTWIGRWAAGSPVANSSSNSDVEYICSFVCFENAIAQQCLTSKTAADAISFLSGLLKANPSTTTPPIKHNAVNIV